MRIMAIDYGDARTGIAVSDLMNTLTGDAFVIPGHNPEQVAQAVAQEAVARGVGTLVLGLPKNMDGTLGPRAEKCRDFAALLESASGLPVILWDERRTTVDAHRILSANGKRTVRHRKTVDAVAASLILEGYLASLPSSLM
ncbi:MAG: Holliday junction resolvase RuvX [Oscillospiraceae bacterium]|nr:Holliday junction resolvase RuvX [Oscillospiraceae bacterium]